MKIKRISSFCSALLLSASSMFVIAVPKALAATATWDGGTDSNYNWTDAENWAGDVAPTAGDDLVFPADITNSDTNNDFTAGTSFNSITLSGAATSFSAYSVTGNAFVIAAGINLTMTGSNGSLEIDAPLTLSAAQTLSAGDNLLYIDGTLSIGANAITLNSGTGYLSVQGVLSGSGSITKSGTSSLSLGGDNSSYSGAITVSAGTLYADHANALGTATPGTTVNTAADIYIATCDDSLTIGENLTLTGASSDTAGDFPTPKLHTSAKGCMGGGGSTESYGFFATEGTVTLSGAITLGSDVTFGSFAKTTTLTGSLSGAFAINLLPGYSGKLVVNASSNTSSKPNGTYTPGTFTKTLSDSQPTSSVNIAGNTEITITGTRGAVTIGSGGVLKGTGTVGNLSVGTGGKLAPGLSPGCINTGNLTFISGSTYEFEVGGTTACTQYDQTKVTGTVDLGNGTLSTVLVNSFTPAANQSYMIIENDGSDAVTGTFNGLAEGATFTVSGYVFKISYVGGTGNDVVLTVQSVPATPNTGSGLMMQNPFVTFALMISLAGGLAFTARRYAYATKR
jgi:fibronectin-binding autotransporter adhesin